CPAGLVALTFDDGPAATVTPVLVHELLHLEVPATFFMVGSRIATAPAAARLVQRSGFTIGNHTWNHPELTALGDPAVRRQLRMTRREMRAVGITPSTLMRPPYGAVNHRILTDVRRLALVPVLWTVDSEDWAGGNARQIASRILGALRRHQTNIVLQHDGVTNSPASVAAVPRVVRIARRRGFCFTGLGSRGRPVVPVRSRPDPVGPPAVTGTTTGPASLRALLTR
ncbi:MAG: polysaccharide deacetylase, partial [Marmoricola sp.]|nr:polysaccharide deacetylase [Marmoricola sp.]